MSGKIKVVSVPCVIVGLGLVLAACSTTTPYRGAYNATGQHYRQARPGASYDTPRYWGGNPNQ
jgi:uncharacterized lipoprotein